MFWRSAMNPSDTTNRPIALPAVPTMPVSTSVDSQLIHSAMVVPGMTSTAGLPPYLQPALAGAPSMASLCQALRRCWPLAVGLAMVAAIATIAAILFVMPAKYAAQVRILISSRGEAKEENRSDGG